MTGAAPGGGAAGFLEFFILEAGDYVEQLDGVLLASRGAGAPDADAMQRVARALRGTATMAKIPAFADVASGIERVGRGLQDGALRWDPGLSGVLVAAIDDLKILLHGARNWGAAEEQRAAARAAELKQYAPARTPAAAPSAQPHASAGPPATFLATEAANIAAGVELLTTRAGDIDTAANVLRRVRALRGVAGVKEVGPLADVLEATEDAARGLESGTEVMSPEARQLLEAAAAYLRTLSGALRGDGGGDVNAPGSSRDAFNSALDNWATSTGEREDVVPISELFYTDGVPGLVEASQNPPTSMAQRFRLELVSLGEHLRQVVDGARHAADTSSTVRSRRDLKRALRALHAAALSFGEHDVAEFINGHVEAADHVDFLGLAALEDLATMLADPGTDGERLSARLREISGGRDLSSAIGMGFGAEEPRAPDVAAARASRPSSPLAIATPAIQAPAVPTPAAPKPAVPTPVAPAPVVPTPRAPTPVVATPVVSTPAAPPPSPRRPTPAPVLDGTSAALIDSSIAALDALNDRPFSVPAPLPEDQVVPIETLLYRGRRALDRAVEIRDEMKRSGNRSDTDALDELFDLLELARAD